MDINLDNNLYNDYLNGNIEAFECIYQKYKDKIRYFIFSIVKNYEKSEDIMQDVFIYILKNKYNENDSSFKYYIYLIAKSKAIAYLNMEKRRNNITEKYFNFNISIIYENGGNYYEKKFSQKKYSNINAFFYIYYDVFCKCICSNYTKNSWWLLLG